jgi:hypothetical protein
MVALVTLAGFALLAAAFVAEFGLFRGPGPLSFVAGLAFTGLLNFVWRRVRCPKCSTILGTTAIYTFVRAQDVRVDFCPHCGASFDEPMPHNPISQ